MPRFDLSLQELFREITLIFLQVPSEAVKLSSAIRRDPKNENTVTIFRILLGTHRG